MGGILAGGGTKTPLGKGPGGWRRLYNLPVRGLRHGNAFKAKGAEPGQRCGSGGLIGAGMVVKGEGDGEKIESDAFDNEKIG